MSALSSRSACHCQTPLIDINNCTVPQHFAAIIYILCVYANRKAVLCHHSTTYTKPTCLLAMIPPQNPLQREVLSSSLCFNIYSFSFLFSFSLLPFFLSSSLLRRMKLLLQRTNNVQKVRSCFLFQAKNWGIRETDSFVDFLLRMSIGSTAPIRNQNR